MAQPRATPKRRKKSAAPPPPPPIARRPPPSGPAADLFWQLIERVEAKSGGKLDRACRAFQAELEQLDDRTLGDVATVFHRAMTCAEDWDLYRAAVVIHGGASDDMFWDFRTGVVALGRRTFEAALADPGSLIDTTDLVERTLFEGFQYVPENVLEARGLPVAGEGGPGGAMSGVRPTDYEECVARFPRLAARFG